MIHQWQNILIEAEAITIGAVLRQIKRGRRYVPRVLATLQLRSCLLTKSRNWSQIGLFFVEQEFIMRDLILLNDQILSALRWRFLLQAKTFLFSRVRICYFLAFPEIVERITFFYLRVWRRLQDCLIGLIAQIEFFFVLLAFLTFQSQLFQGRPCRIVYSQHVGCRNVYSQDVCCRNVYSHNIYLLNLQQHIFVYSYKFVNLV